MPVIAGGKAYQFGYYGTTDDLKEALVCFDASSGEVLWQKRHSDFISDIVYNRYGVGVFALTQIGYVYLHALVYLLDTIRTVINYGTLSHGRVC